MSTPPDIGLSIVALAPSDKSDVTVLFNLYELPMDSESISSSIQDETVRDSGFDGVTSFNANEWLTGLSVCEGTQFACSMEGVVQVGPAGGALSAVKTGAKSGFNGVHGVSGRDAFAVALDGSVWQVSGAQASLAMPGSGVRLNAIHGCGARCLYAVGDEGQLLHFDGQAWSRLPLLTNVNLLCVLCVAPDEVYIGGARGVLFKWDGRSWVELEAPAMTLSGLAKFQGQLYAAGGKDGIFVLKGLALEQLKAKTFYKVCVSNDKLFAVGGDFFAWFDGVGWMVGQLQPY